MSKDFRTTMEKMTEGIVKITSVQRKFQSLNPLSAIGGIYNQRFHNQMNSLTSLVRPLDFTKQFEPLRSSADVLANQNFGLFKVLDVASEIQSKFGFKSIDLSQSLNPFKGLFQVHDVFKTINALPTQYASFLSYSNTINNLALSGIFPTYSKDLSGLISKSHYNKVSKLNVFDGLSGNAFQKLRAKYGDTDFKKEEDEINLLLSDPEIKQETEEFISTLLINQQIAKPKKYKQIGEILFELISKRAWSKTVHENTISILCHVLEGLLLGIIVYMAISTSPSNNGEYNKIEATLNKSNKKLLRNDSLIINFLQSKENSHRIYQCFETTLYNSNSTKSRKITKIAESSSVKLLKANRKWCFIELQDSTHIHGWIKKESIILK